MLWVEVDEIAQDQTLLVPSQLIIQVDCIVDYWLTINEQKIFVRLKLTDW